MLDIFTPHSERDALTLLKKDHQKVAELFKKFEDAETIIDRKKICMQVIDDLKIHTTIEEEVFYPAIRGVVGKDLMTEADEEHHVAKVLIAELEEMTGQEDHFNGKFKVLAENVKHHVKEEEHHIFPKVRASSLDLEELGVQLLARKHVLMQLGVATFAEERMVAYIDGHGDSPAQAAQRY